MPLSKRIYIVFQSFCHRVSIAFNVAVQCVQTAMGRKKTGTLPHNRDQSPVGSASPGPSHRLGILSLTPDRNEIPNNLHRNVASPNLVNTEANTPNPEVVLHDPEGVRHLYGVETYKSAHATSRLGRSQRMTRSESSQSDLGLENIETINDRGMEAHTSWEESLSGVAAEPVLPDLSKSSDLATQTRHSWNLSFLGASSRHIGGLLSAQNDRNSITVDSISNQICHAFERSAFNEKSYLPLDRFAQIVTPSVIRTLLRQHFKDDDLAREMEAGVLGGQDSSIGPTRPLRRRIFTILILVGKIERIQQLIALKIDDTALPFVFQPADGSVPEKVLLTNEDPPVAFAQWPSKIAHDFSHYQHAIHVPFLKFPDDSIYFYNLQHEAILPFNHYKLRDSGGYSNVRQAKIHHAHHSNKRSTEVTHLICLVLSLLIFPNTNQPQGGTTQLVAVKQLHIPNRADYLEEVNVFGKLGIGKRESMASHLIPLQLTFKHGRDYFLIFPWADGNLKYYWKTNIPDAKSHRVMCWFFDQCWGIARGLRKIHHLGTVPKEGMGTNKLDVKDISKLLLNSVPGGREWGRHSDIKPENILWFKNYEGRPNHLVISDFGLTRFNSAQSKSRVLQEEIKGFSGTYRPPDLHLNEAISQRYDVWSLGCVFLEFTSWLLLGYRTTIEDFATKRVNDPLENSNEGAEDKFFGLISDADGTQRATLKTSVVEVSCIFC